MADKTAKMDSSLKTDSKMLFVLDSRGQLTFQGMGERQCAREPEEENI